MFKEFTPDNHSFFTATFIVLTIIVVTTFIKFLKKEKTTSASANKTLLAIWVVTMMQLFIVSKHFAQHYMVPVHLLIIPVWIIIFISRFPQLSKIKFSVAAVFLFAAVFLYKSIVQYHFYPNLMQPGKQLYNSVKDKKYDLTYFDCNVTAPLPQVALLFGVNYSGDMGSRYKYELQKIYPPFLWTNRGNGMLRDWNGEYQPKDVLKDSVTMLYYADNPDFEVKKQQWADGHIKVDTVLFSCKSSLTGESVHIIKLKKE